MTANKIMRISKFAVMAMAV